MFLGATAGATGYQVTEMTWVLPLGDTYLGYVFQDEIDAEVFFADVLADSTSHVIDWLDPATQTTKQLFYTTFPTPGWVNEIGNVKFGQAYLMKMNNAYTFKYTAVLGRSPESHDLEVSFQQLAFTQPEEEDAQAAFQDVIDAGKLDKVRWVDPDTLGVKELFYTTFPTPGWVNEIGNLKRGQGYLVDVNATYSGLKL